MSSVLSSNLVVDASSPLGARVSSLLQLSNEVRALQELEGATLLGARVLLVDAGHDHIDELLQRGAQHVVHVRSQAMLGGEREQSGVSTVRIAQPLQESLLPRLRHALRTGRFLSSAAHQSAAYVAREDVAMVAALTLAADEQLPSSLTLTGPVMFTHAELVGLTRRIVGRAFTMEEVAHEALLPALLAGGLARAEAQAAATADALLASQRPLLTQDIARTTGMLPLALSALLRRERAWLLKPASAAALPVRGAFVAPHFSERALRS